MKKKDRQKYLKELANSTLGEALREHFQEKIDDLTDARNYETNDFEMEGKASVKAADVLGKMLRELNTLKKGKNKEKNEYL